MPPITRNLAGKYQKTVTESGWHSQRPHPCDYFILYQANQWPHLKIHLPFLHKVHKNFKELQNFSYLELIVACHLNRVFRWIIIYPLKHQGWHLKNRSGIHLIFATCVDARIDTAVDILSSQWEVSMWGRGTLKLSNPKSKRNFRLG